MKRGRGGTLTGGTGDVNPQNYTINLLQPAPDTNDARSLPVPVYRFPLKNDRAMVMEILKSTWIIRDLNAAAAQASIVGVISTAGLGLVDGATSTADQQYNALASPNVITSLSIDFIFASGVGFAWSSRKYEYDHTDAAGHGILVATDAIYAYLLAIGTGVIQGATCRLLYRWKEVPLSEYIGIVQAQQTATTI